MPVDVKLCLLHVKKIYISHVIIYLVRKHVCIRFIVQMIIMVVVGGRGA